MKNAQKEIEVEKEDFIIGQHKTVKNQADNSCFRLNKMFWELLDEYKVLLLDKQDKIREKNKMLAIQESEDFSKEKLEDIQTKLDQAIVKYDENNKKFKEFTVKLFELFVGNKQKDYVNFPENTSQEWRAFIYELADKHSLQYNKLFKQKGKFCTIWKQNSDYEKRIQKQESIVMENLKQIEQEQQIYQQNQKIQKSQQQKKQLEQQIQQPKIKKPDQQSNNQKSIPTIQNQQQQQQQQQQKQIPDKQEQQQFYELCPDKIEEIYICDFLIDSNTLTMEFQLPEYYDNNITEICVYQNLELVESIQNFDNQDNQVYISLQLDKLNLSDNYYQKIQISSKNIHGESPKSDAIKFIKPENNKYRLFMTGSFQNQQIPMDSLYLGDYLNNAQFDEIQQQLSSFTEVKFNQEETESQFQQIVVKEQAIVKTIYGQIAEWGKIPSPLEEFQDQDEFSKEELQTKLQNLLASPFTILDGYGIIVNSITCGKLFSGITSIDGKVYTWGYNQYGQLGHNDTITRLTPTLVTYFQNENIFITDLQAGDSHLVSLSDKQRVYSWGFQQVREGKQILNRFGQIVNIENQGTCLRRPFLQDNIHDCRKISVFGNNSGALTQDNQLYVWGDNFRQQLGCNKSAHNLVIPICIDNTQFDFLDFSQGQYHCLSIVKCKQSQKTVLLGWGSNIQGQLGLKEDINELSQPQIIEFFTDKNVQAISCGKYNSLVLCQNQETQQQELFGFGESFKGVLGIPSQQNKQKYYFAPVNLTDYIPKDTIIQSIYCGIDNSCILASNKNIN